MINEFLRSIIQLMTTFLGELLLTRSKSRYEWFYELIRNQILIETKRVLSALLDRDDYKGYLCSLHICVDR
jgi:hypothetical protein